MGAFQSVSGVFPVHRPSGVRNVVLNRNAKTALMQRLGDASLYLQAEGKADRRHILHHHWRSSGGNFLWKSQAKETQDHFLQRGLVEGFTEVAIYFLGISICEDGVQRGCFSCFIPDTTFLVGNRQPNERNARDFIIHLSSFSSLFPARLYRVCVIESSPPDCRHRQTRRRCAGCRRGGGHNSN